jgi:hypothetical protein
MDCSIRTSYVYLDLRGMFGSGIFESDVKIICPGIYELSCSRVVGVIFLHVFD